MLFYLIVFVFAFSPMAFAQGLKDFNPTYKAANTEGLGKYGGVPVSYFTGTAQSEIELYTIKTPSLELPINLTYNASGIRVDDIASWVGLGWDMNAGGVISIDIKGISDFSIDAWGNSERVDIKNGTDLLNGNILSSSETSGIIDLNKDAEPDIYNYNFCGYSGQFILDEDFSVKFLRNTDGLSIVYKNNSFTIRDKIGNEYIFNILEKTNTYTYYRALYYTSGATTNITMGPLELEVNQPAGKKDQISGIYLSKIILTNNDEINFSYRDELEVYDTRYNGSIILDDDETDCRTITRNQINEYGFTFNTIKTQSKKLSQIRYSRENLIVNFLSNSTRLDLVNCGLLSKIEILSQNSELFHWDFGYSYFVSSVSLSEKWWPTTNADYKGVNNPLGHRLKLNSVQRKSGQLSENPYSFEYYGDDVSSNLEFPPRNSFDGVDFWGYCNGNVSASSVTLPKNLFHTFSMTIHNLDAVGWNENYDFKVVDLDYMLSYKACFDGGDKMPNPNYSKTYSLQKITYPTKGYTEFEYEGHDHIYQQSFGHSSYGSGIVGGIRIKKIISKNLHSDPIEKKYIYHNGVAFGEPIFLGYQFRDAEALLNIAVNIFPGGVPNLAPPISGFVLHSMSLNPFSEPGIFPISYQYVDEIGADGKTTYYYHSLDEYTRSFDYYVAYDVQGAPVLSGHAVSNDPKYPFVEPVPYKTYKLGNLKKIEYLKNDGNSSYLPVKIIEFDYIEYDLFEVWGNEARRITSTYNTGYPSYSTSMSTYYYQKAYNYFCGGSLMSQEKITSYDDNGIASTPIITDFTYVGLSGLIKTKEVNNGSNLLKSVTNYGTESQYLTNWNQYDFMKNNNMIDYPVETINYLDNKIVSAELVDYSNPVDAQCITRPYKIKNLAISSPLTTITNSSFNYISGANGYVDGDVNYIQSYEYIYDELGNVIFQEDFTNGVYTSYIWGYNKSKPIAIIKNTNHFSYSYVLSFFTSTELANLQFDTQTLTQSQIILLLNKLRVVNWSVISYTYDGYGNITSETNESGFTTYFEYDSLGRLIRIKDNLGKIIKENEYNYAQ